MSFKEFFLMEIDPHGVKLKEIPRWYYSNGTKGEEIPLAIK